MTKGSTNAQTEGGTTYTAGTGIIIDSGKIIQDGIVDLTGTTASDSTGLSLSYSEGGTKYNGNYVSRSNSVILFKTGDGLSWDTSTSPPTLKSDAASTSIITDVQASFLTSSYATNHLSSSLNNWNYIIDPYCSYSVSWNVDTSLLGSRTGTLTLVSGTITASDGDDWYFSTAKTISLTNTQLKSGSYTHTHTSESNTIKATKSSNIVATIVLS